eukprot:46560-Eustigmatos_ZCMA.PRE.1
MATTTNSSTSSLPMRALQFYTEVLGATESKGLPGTLGTDDSVLLGFDPNGVKIELVQLPNGERVDHRCV